MLRQGSYYLQGAFCGRIHNCPLFVAFKKIYFHLVVIILFKYRINYITFLPTLFRSRLLHDVLKVDKMSWKIPVRLMLSHARSHVHIIVKQLKKGNPQVAFSIPLNKILFHARPIYYWFHLSKACLLNRWERSLSPSKARIK